MMMDKNYRRYLSLKERFNFIYKDVEYGKVLAFDLGMIAFKHLKPRINRETLYDLFFSVDISLLIKVCSENDKLMLCSMDRVDYKIQVDKTTENLSSVESILLENLDKKFKFNPIRIISSFYLSYKLLKGQESFFVMLFVASKIVFYKNIHHQLLHNFNGIKGKKLITFNSAVGAENLICQIFNINDGITFSLSHGFFVLYKDFIPIDIINGENIVAQKILVWGSDSVIDLNRNYKLSKERIVVAGNAKYPSKTIKVKQTFEKCIVLLGRPIYNVSNLEIIKILKKTILESPMISFDVKLHPSLNIELYKELCDQANIKVLEGNKSLIDIFGDDKYDFAIVNNSTAYYEAMYADMICFRYELSENEQFNGLVDRFLDSETLKNRIEYFANIDSIKINSEVEVLLNTTLGMGINNYSQIID
jgi:hypothetical protein